MRSTIYGIISIFGVFFCSLKDAADCEYMDSSFQRSTPQGKRLTGITVKRVNVKNEMACARECLNLASCFSVNMGPPLTPGDTGLNCELNLDTALGSGKELQNHPDYTYFERVCNIFLNFWIRKINHYQNFCLNLFYNILFKGTRKFTNNIKKLAESYNNIIISSLLQNTLQSTWFVWYISEKYLYNHSVANIHVCTLYNFNNFIFLMIKGCSS